MNTYARQEKTRERIPQDAPACRQDHRDGSAGVSGRPRPRLKPKSLRRYESVIDLFQHCLNEYAYQSLDKAESALFEQLDKATGESHRDFCQILGRRRSPRTSASSWAIS